jgi:colanic acid biosynthesis glycosyl transferase WcaI
MMKSEQTPPPILFVTRYYWPELIGSAPFSSDIAEWLARHGRQVKVLSGLPHYPAAEVFPAYRDGRCRNETVNGVEVERLGVAAPRGPSALWRIANELQFLLKGLFALASGRVRRHRVVLALCPSILCVALGLLACRRGGVCIAVVHDIQSGLAQGLGMVGGHGRLAGLMRWCERAILNRTAQVVVLSSEMQDQLRRIGVSVPIEVMPIWVDTDQVRPDEPAAAARRCLRVLYSGNLGRKQGLGQVVALAEQLASRRPEIEIIVRGNGSQAQDLATEISVRQLDNVRLLALQPQERLGHALSAGDIHLVPQNPETAAFAVPSKVFNIMAVGRPFVATALPGSLLWQLQERSRAFLCVPPNEPSAFADAVLRLADDKALRLELGRRGRAFVEVHYAKPRILGDFMSRLDAISADA